MRASTLARGALIGALYVLLTFLSIPLGPIASIRLSEALCVLPFFCPEAVAGLFIGCLAANLITGCVALDVVFGSLATLAAAYITLWFKRRGFSKWLAPLPAVAINALVVGALLKYAYELPFSLALCMAGVAAGQVISCYIIGMPLFFTLDRFKNSLFEQRKAR